MPSQSAVPPELAELRRAKRRAESSLLERPGVVGVDVGPKIVGGRATELPAIRVYVVAKRDVPDEEAIPAELEGHSTDVIQTRFVAHGAPGGAPRADGDSGFGPPPSISGRGTSDRSPLPDSRRYAALLGGISVGACRGEASGGTLATLVRDRASGQPLLLGNFHVLALDSGWRPGEPVLQPARIDGGQCPRDVVGLLERALLVESFAGGPGIDAAVARPTARPGFGHVLGLGPTVGPVEAAPGEEVRKRGRSTGSTRGKVEGLDLTVLLDMGPRLGERRLRDQVVVASLSDEPFARAGDSGALVVDASGGCVGLHVGGSEDGRLGVATPFHAVLEALDLEPWQAGPTPTPRASGGHRPHSFLVPWNASTPKEVHPMAGFKRKDSEVKLEDLKHKDIKEKDFKDKDLKDLKDKDFKDKEKDFKDKDLKDKDKDLKDKDKDLKDKDKDLKDKDFKDKEKDKDKDLKEKDKDFEGPGFETPFDPRVRLEARAPIRATAQALHCIDFSAFPVGPRPNPWNVAGMTFEAFDHASLPWPNFGIQNMGGFTGLDTGYQLVIQLGRVCSVVELTLVHFSSPATAKALDAGGGTVAGASMAPPQGNPQTLVLAAPGIVQVVIDAPQDECLLLRICCDDARRPRVEEPDRPHKADPEVTPKPWKEHEPKPIKELEPKPWKEHLEPKPFKELEPKHVKEHEPKPWKEDFEPKPFKEIVETPNPGGGVVDPPFGMEGRLRQLENQVGQLTHFISQSQRPDLQSSALRNEPDAGGEAGDAPDAGDAGTAESGSSPKRKPSRGSAEKSDSGTGSGS
ncbi:MAG: hypothetical protein MI919_32850 [Holophagales bacterium]|nr:hypothetical protein [Holophagales bacterium]